MTEIARVMLPSGDLIWVRAQAAEPASAGDQIVGPADVGLGERMSPAARLLHLPGFAETVRGVVTSVRQSFGEQRPDCLEVEFGIEIVARTGGLLSVLAEIGGTAQVRVTASWNRRDGSSSRSGDEESEPQ